MATILIDGCHNDRIDARSFILWFGSSWQTRSNRFIADCIESNELGNFMRTNGFEIDVETRIKINRNNPNINAVMS